MEPRTEAFVLDRLGRPNLLTLATVRKDGWPQATTAGDVNGGRTLSVGAGVESQRVHSVRGCPVSLTVGHAEPDGGKIQGRTQAQPHE